MSFAELLREHRRRVGLTQEELAERARLSVRGISDLERGLKQAPRPSTVRLVVQALELDGAAAARLLAAAQGHDRARGPKVNVAPPRHNLPRQLTSFVGRERELAELQGLLGSTPLLTLTGAGGVGKTRLALRLAEAVTPQYGDGVWLVELAALTNADLIAQAVAVALGLREEPGRELRETLIAGLRGRRLLLVLDNCEHVVHACAELAEGLLRACADLRLLATSREPLAVAGEHLWSVPPLSVPDAGASMPETLQQAEAVRLFVQRATAVQPRFALTPANGAAVAQVCRRLDGVPLALELAAARVATLAPGQIAQRLDDRFRLLTAATRTAPPRHQTLRATVDWSYELLSEPERRAFERVAVFSGGWTLEAAETVCADDGIRSETVLDLLGRLVDRSLVMVEQLDDAEPRYHLLEILREYGLERLTARGDSSAVRARHAARFLALGEEVQPFLAGGSGQLHWLQRLEPERANLRVALRWCVESGQFESGLRLARALWWFWLLRGSLVDRREWTALIVRLAEAGPPNRLTALALDGAEALASESFEGALARDIHSRSMRIWSTLGRDAQPASSLGSQGWAALQRRDLEQARDLLERGLARARAEGDVVEEAITLNNLGRALGELGDDAAARDRHSLALRLFRELHDRHGAALALSWLAHWALLAGDRVNALAAGQEALTFMRAIGAERNIGWTCADLGIITTPDDSGAARAFLREALEHARAGGQPALLSLCLEAIAGLALTEGRPLACIRLAAAAATRRAAVGQPTNRAPRELVAAWLRRARAMVPGNSGEEAWAAGQMLSEDEAVAEALVELDITPPSVNTPRTSADIGRLGDLTPREREVVALLTRGLSNSEIARELVMSQRTAAHHVEHILAKLDAPSRAAAAAYAARAGLTDG